MQQDFRNFFVTESTRPLIKTCFEFSLGNLNNLNPMFLIGTTGTGKTHLLKAIKVKYERKNPDKKATYITSEEFVSRLILSYDTNDAYDTNHDIYNADLLLIDDIQFFYAKAISQEQIYRAIKSLLDRGKLVAVATTNEKDVNKWLYDENTSKSRSVCKLHLKTYTQKDLLQILESVYSQHPEIDEYLGEISSINNQNIRYAVGMANKVLFTQNILGISAYNCDFNI